MITLLKQLFLDNWLRKLVSFLLAVILWFAVNRSIMETKIVSDIPVKVTNLAPGKTIEGMQSGGALSEKVSLTLYGDRSYLNEIKNSDLEVVIDAAGKPNEWTAIISKKNLISTNSEINLHKTIKKVAPLELAIRQTKLVQDKIPVTITQPIGEAPKGYHYLDIFPYQLNLTVVGPEETVKRLKSRGGLQLTFNLNDISSQELEVLQSNNRGISDEVSFFVPNSWKKIQIPGLTEAEVEIDDPQAKALRIDFSRQDLLPIGSPIPIALFFSPKFSEGFNPERYILETNDFITKKNGIKMISLPLWAEGVSQKFLEQVKDHLQVVVVVSTRPDPNHLVWNLQLVCPHELEDRFVAKAIAESSQELRDLQPHLREEYLRNRFRSYMNRFRLYTPNHKKLRLNVRIDGNSIIASPENYP